MEVNSILGHVLAFIAAIVITEALDRLWSRFAPHRVKEFVSKARFYCLFPVRQRTSDWIYKLWLREGIVDVEKYREFQELNIIHDDLEPEYIKYY